MPLETVIPSYWGKGNSRFTKKRNYKSEKPHICGAGSR